MWSVRLYGFSYWWLWIAKKKKRSSTYLVLYSSQVQLFSYTVLEICMEDPLISLDFLIWSVTWFCYSLERFWWLAEHRLWQVLISCIQTHCLCFSFSYLSRFCICNKHRANSPLTSISCAGFTSCSWSTCTLLPVGSHSVKCSHESNFLACTT